MKLKTKSIDLYITPGTFYFLFRRSYEGYDFNELSELRHLLSNEKAKIISIIKTKNPDSMYQLAKLVQRDFKSVKKDLATLKKFGIIDFVHTEKGKRKRLKPVMAIDKLQVNIDFT
jgi:predicted transcriptional regulator